VSRGPGRIERAIIEAFTANPSMTFTVDDLAAIAYPGLNRIEKKHRVAVLRAADKVAAQLWWGGRRMERPGHPVVYFNLLDHRSYVIGQIRATDDWWGMGHCEITAAIDDPASDFVAVSRWRKDLQPGSPYWQHVEINRAEHQRDHEKAEALRAELKTSLGGLAAALGIRL
jgi:hypothetical protein